jgi:hypothetical protein
MRKICTLVTSKATDIDENIANQNHATRTPKPGRGILKLTNIYFQKAFSQSGFQKGPELNKQIYKEDMHILQNYEKYLGITRGKCKRLLKSFS